MDNFDLPEAFKKAWRAEFERPVPTESFPDLILLYADSEGALIDLDELQSARQFTDWVKEMALEIHNTKVTRGRRPNPLSPYRRAHRFAIATYFSWVRERRQGTTKRVLWDHVLDFCKERGFQPPKNRARFFREIGLESLPQAQAGGRKKRDKRIG
jgi:hypothetical protein